MHRVELVQCDDIKLLEAHNVAPDDPGGTLSTVQSVLGARASCLSSFPLVLQTVVVIWNLDVQLAIEAAEAPKRRVDGVESVGGSDDDRLPTTLHAIHVRQKWETMRIFSRLEQWSQSHQ